jgi:hypothetical protein
MEFKNTLGCDRLTRNGCSIRCMHSEFTQNTPECVVFTQNKTWNASKYVVHTQQTPRTRCMHSETTQNSPEHRLLTQNGLNSTVECDTFTQNGRWKKLYSLRMHFGLHQMVVVPAQNHSERTQNTLKALRKHSNICQKTMCSLRKGPEHNRTR